MKEGIEWNGFDWWEKERIIGLNMAWYVFVVYCLYKIKLNIKKGKRVRKKLVKKGKKSFLNPLVTLFNVFLIECNMIYLLINNESNIAINSNPCGNLKRKVNPVNNPTNLRFPFEK